MMVTVDAVSTASTTRAAVQYMLDGVTTIQYSYVHTTFAPYFKGKLHCISAYVLEINIEHYFEYSIDQLASYPSLLNKWNKKF